MSVNPIICTKISFVLSKYSQFIFIFRAKQIQINAMFLRFLCLVLLLTIGTESSKILIINQSFTKAHIIPLQVLAKELVGRGHEITFVSMYPLDHPVQNYTDIKVEVTPKILKSIEKINKALTESENVFKIFPLLNEVVFVYGNKTLQSPAIKSLKNKNFDLLIVGYFMNEHILGFADHFKCPSIMVFAGIHDALCNGIVGNPLSTEGSPHGLLESKNMNFMMRVKNFMLYGFERELLGRFFKYQSRQIYK